VAAGTVTALVTAAVAGGRVGPVEEAVFRFVNGWPDDWRWPLWSVQLLGVLGVPLVVAAVAAACRRWRLTVALVLLVPLKLLVERAVLKELVHRERPGTTVPGAILRGDEVNTIGQSFPSGHAIIAFGVTVLLLPYLHRRRPAVLVLVLVLAVLNGMSRIYLGAHLPLDVVAGAAAGVGVAALLNLLVGVPLEPRTAPHVGSVDRKERRWHSG
jgi:undecaprenyl-diphosphatase